MTFFIFIDMTQLRYQIKDFQNISIEYGNATLGQYSTLNVIKEFQKYGGSISPNTEMEFHQ